MWPEPCSLRLWGSAGGGAPCKILNGTPIDEEPPLLPSLECRISAPALKEVMETLAELMQRLLEIQSGGRQRSAALIAEDERLMDGLHRKLMAEKPTQTVRLSPDNRERTRFKT